MDELMSLLISQSRGSSLSYNQYLEKHCYLNLKNYLLNTTNHNLVFLGKAPGYRGCRVTGIPFTATRELITLKLKIPDLLVPNKSFNPNEEITSKCFWDIAKEMKILPLVWNSFPYHPFKEIGNDTSNRKPTHGEVKSAKVIFDKLLELFKPKTIICVGRVAEKMCLNDINYPTKYIIEYLRHPAHGGQNTFKLGFKALIEKYK